MIPETTRDKDFKKLKEENQKKIKKMYAIPKVRILKDFVVDYIFLTNHPMLKNTWKSKVLYEGRDYEGGNED